MSAGLEVIHRAVERETSDAPGRTRRQVIGGAAAAVGGMGLVGALPAVATAGGRKGHHSETDVQTVLNVAASAEVLATIVNTVGWERRLGGDRVTQRNLAAAAQEELRHYDVLESLGGHPASTKIWVPDSVLANRTNFLNTLVVGDQIFVNAYLIGVACFAEADPKLAAVPAEFMGAEAVHRALALQSLGELGNDRIFMAVDFFFVEQAVTRLQAAGFGFGERGDRPGRFFRFERIRNRVPTDPDVNTPDPTPIDC